MDIVIRPMIESDWAAVSGIYHQGILTGNATFQSEIPSYEDWDAAHIQECRFVAADGNSVVGWAALSKVSSRCVYAGVAELSIYIAEKARGNGVGRALLRHLVIESERAGYWLLQSGILDRNLPSLKLHENCGFRKVGYREKIGRDTKGEWRSTVLMEKRSQTVGIN